MKNTIDGKVVVIAGGARNLGGLLARDFAENGAKAVAIHYHSDSAKKAAEETLDAVKERGADGFIIQGDLSKPKENARLFSETKGKFGSVNIAINTAGMVLKKSIDDVTEAEYDKMFDVNSKAAFFFIKEAGKALSDNGKLVSVVTSLLGAYTDSYSTYAGAKAPVEHFTRAASKELGARGISVTAVGPGPMDTSFFYGQESKEAQEYHKSAAALSNFSKTGLTDLEDIVPFIRFLASDGWWITGQTILANGGYTTK